MIRLLRQAGLAVFLLGVLSSPLRADVSVSVSVDKNKVALNDTVRLSVVVEGSGNVPAPSLPDLTAFNVYSSGRSQNISFVNGQMSSSVSHNFSLMPKSVGTFVIGPFTVNADGKTYQSQPVSIEVVSAAAPPPSQPQSGQQPESGSRSPGAFVRMSASKSRVLLNEEVILSFRFYHRIQLVSNPEYNAPELTGFIYEDLPPPRNFQESVNGAAYRVTEIKTALFPAKTGRAVIPPATLKIAVQDFSRNNPNDIFNMFFSGGAKEYLLKTDPVEIVVNALPSEGKPAGFSGGVGEFGLSTSLDKSKPQAGDPVTLTVTVSGTGNFKSLGDPVFPEFKGFRKYDTASSLNIDKARDKVEGSKVYKLILVPLVSGRLTIPEITFSYFNLREKKYKTLSSQPLNLDVKPGDPAAAPAPSANQQAPRIEKFEDQIRFIKLGALSEKPYKHFHKRRTFLILNLIPLAALLGAGAFRLAAVLRMRNPVRRRRALALSRAEKELKSGRPLDALTQYFADKMNVPSQGISWKDAENFLISKKMDSAAISELKSLWSDLEVLHYAPAQFRSSGVEDLCGRAKKILKKIEKGVWVLLFVLGTGALIHSQPSATAFEEGNQLYQQGQYGSALSKYEEAASRTGLSPQVEFNLGNAFYQQGAIGRALVHWNRAFRMTPTDADVRFNLDFGSKMAGEPFLSSIAPYRWAQILHYSLSLNRLACLWLCVLWVFSFYFSFLLAKGRALWNANVFALLILAVAVGTWSLFRFREEAWQNWAVVTESRAEVRSGPGEQFPTGFTLPDGRRVVVLSEREGMEWSEIGVPKEGLKGWVLKSKIEKI